MKPLSIKRLVRKFNHPDVQLVVSGWPEKLPNGQGYHGDAAFTKETLLSLVKQKKMRFVVIAEVNHDNEPEITANGNILVLRVIDHGKFRLYPTVLTWLNKFPAIKHVTVHSNFTYSGIKHFTLLIPFLWIIKLTGRKLSLVSHNVLDSVDFLAKQLNAKNKLLIGILNHALQLYYHMLGFVVNQLIVLDTQGQKILKKYITEQKLVYIPHFVKPRSTSLSQKKAKQILGISDYTKVILCFGFISYYKGSDQIARLFAKKFGNNKKYKLIFAGGKSPSLSHTPHYQTYYVRFKEFISNFKNIELTGFLNEEKLAPYFSAADIVVLPYRGLMGGSGAFSYAVGYKKPFLLSTQMKNLLENPDIKLIMNKLKVQSNSILFDLEENGMKKVEKILNNSYTLKKIISFSAHIRKVRNITEMTNYMYDQLYEEDYLNRYVKQFKPSYALD